MSYNGIPIPTEVDFDHVLTSTAVAKLQAYGLLGESPDIMGFWDIEPLPFNGYLSYPYIGIHSKKISAYFNHPSIGVYIGFKVVVGVDIYMRFYQRTAETGITRINTIEAFHKYVDDKWSARAHLDSTIGTPMGRTVMNQMGLVIEVQAEVENLYLEFQRNAGIFQAYFDRNHNTNIENLEAVDFIKELITQRMMKLEKLNESVLQFLH